MKNNGNNRKTGDYYLGLDVGTDSVGWAVTDNSYNLLRLRGKDAWGVRLFDEGETAQSRRMFRTSRRRLQRRKWRLTLLKTLFAEEIAKVDAGFYQRMDESSRVIEDKTFNAKYSLFADPYFTDKDYFKEYPTIYHLRKELIYSKQPHDVRLVYLAIHHILKSRGHFLYSFDSDGEESFESFVDAYTSLIQERFDIWLNITDLDSAKKILCDKHKNKKDKLADLKKIVTVDEECDIERKTLNAVYDNLIKLMAGSIADLNKLFFDSVFEDKLSFCVSDGEDKFAQVCDALGDDADLIIAAKNVYDRAIFDGITNSYPTFSEYKISQYNEHHDDVKMLKDYVKKILNNKTLAKEIFDINIIEVNKKPDNTSGDDGEEQNKKIIANYAAYSRYKNGDLSGGVSQEEFCKFLKKKLGDIPVDVDEKYLKMMEKIKEGTFAPKLKSSENGVVSNSLHRKELEVILKNASGYLSFLTEKDENGLSVADKVLSIFDYKLPYYVGPLKGGWAVRNSGSEKDKILPWNIDDIINHNESSKKFIERMTALCTYTGDDVLPADSLLYSEFCVLNEINNIKINGNPIDVHTKQMIYDELFLKTRRKVSKKSIMNFLKKEGLARDDDIIGGVDDAIKSGLRSYHDLKDIIGKTSYDDVEDIIRHIVLLGNDKNMLREWIKSHKSLSDEDIKRICRLKYNKWGRLSKTFLTQIYDIDRQSGTGEMVSVLEMLRRTNENLMKLLSDKYEFRNKAAEYKVQKLGICENPRKMVDDLYVSPKIRRSIWQALRIADEITDIKKCAPKKIFIEVARDNADESKKGKRTNSRKEQLRALYEQCEKNGKELLKYIGFDRFDDLKRRLNNEADSASMSKHLFLYYRQFGKCMYTGESIELSELKNKNMYDIDHIFPRSKIKDDSFDNMVLVKAKLNRDKTNSYPIDYEIRENMYAFWKHLLNIEAISQKKFERLTRHTPLEQDELAEFINRQLVETRQSTKALAEILGCIYGNDKIVYSKAENISDFRDCYNMLKCRELNDLHHAQDAYLNIVVGNYFDTRFTDVFRKNIANENYNLKTEKLYASNVKNAWQAGSDGTIATVRKVMAKNSVLYTRMPFEVRGKLFDVQPLRKKEGLVPLKVGEDTNIYGGYNSPKGAYWALVERRKNHGKTVKVIKVTRSLEAVFIMDKMQYEKDPQAFAQNHWLEGYDEIKVIIPKIMKQSLLEINGTRMHVTGRSGNQLLMIHANQWHISYEDTIRFKKVFKYVERCKKTGKTIDAYPSDGVDIDTCEYLYDLIIQKLKSHAYKIVPMICEYMDNMREKFITCRDDLARCKVLMQCVNALRCNVVLTGFKDIGGPNNIGKIRLSKVISNCKSAYLINQSVTGLYEKKIDLLR